MTSSITSTVLLSIIVVCLFVATPTYGQSVIIPRADPGTTPGTISAVIVSSCRLVATSTSLGYSPGTNRRVYLNSCSGSCLFVSSAPTQCSSTTQTIQVATQPFSSNTRRVTQVSTCNCQATRCSVTNNGVTNYYNDGDTVVDQCERRCTCSFGRLINCCRQRKEFRLGLSTQEKQRYVNAVRTASTTEPYRTQYINLMRKHTIQFGNGIHGAPLFYPWHREYMWDFENLLRQVDCRITIPYWRWSLEATSPFSSSIWAATAGFGGNGSRQNLCVTNGPFSSPWVTQENPPRCLARDFALTATLATEADIAQMIEVDCRASTQFNCFASTLEGYHNYFHGAVGGHMVGSLSTNDPMFFMHHSFIDRLWARWQSKSAAHTSAYSANLDQVHPGSNTTVRMWLDLTRQGGNSDNQVCYIDPPNTWWIQTALTPNATAGAPNLQSFTADSEGRHGQATRPAFNSLGNYEPMQKGCTTADRIRALPRIPLGPFPEEFLKAMNMSQDRIDELRQFHDIRNNNYTIISVTTALTSRGPYADLGFFMYDEDFNCFNQDGTSLSASTVTGGASVADDESNSVQVVDP